MNEALLRLLAELDDGGYDFITVTPETHRRVLERRGAESARDWRDVFGWSMPFDRDVLADPVLDALEEAGCIEAADGRWRSTVRVSALSGRLFVHSAYPTTEEDAVFFGPDTYRFARFLEAEVPRLGPVQHLVDIGAGSGAGGITAAVLADPVQVTLTDINAEALNMAAVNAAAARIDVNLVQGGLEAAAGAVDLIVANPPYIADPMGRDYRDGGDALGTRLSIEWALAGARRLEPGGTMLLYSGSPIVGGEDRLLAGLAEGLDELGCTLRYEELDPDVFGEELEQPAYRKAGVERIAAVGATIRRD